MRNIYLLVLLTMFSLHAKAEVLSSELFILINERLTYMEDVALFKAHNRLPIEDVAREKVVIEKAKMYAYEKGLDPDHIEEFFIAQISVAKAIQFRYRADLLFQSSAQKPIDLQKKIRPRLLILGDQIIEQIAIYIKTHGSFKFETLTKSNRYTIAYGLASAKKVETRQKRFNKFMDMLIRYEKPG